MAVRKIEGPATVTFRDGSRMFINQGDSRKLLPGRIEKVEQHSLHGSNTVERAARLNALGAAWRRDVNGPHWVHFPFTAAATEYIKALEAEVERVGIIIDRSGQ